MEKIEFARCNRVQIRTLDELYNRLSREAKRNTFVSSPTQYFFFFRAFNTATELCNKCTCILFQVSKIRSMN